MAGDRPLSKTTFATATSLLNCAAPRRLPRLPRSLATSTLARDGSTISRRLREIEPCAAIARASQTQPRPPTRNEWQTRTARGAIRMHGWPDNQSPLAKVRPPAVTLRETPSLSRPEVRTARKNGPTKQHLLNYKYLRVAASLLDSR